MPAPMVKTKTPGIFKRGGRYVVVYYVDGKQRKESARTYDEARRLKSERQTEAARGEFHERSRVTFNDYALEWVQRYQGRGRHGALAVVEDFDVVEDLEPQLVLRRPGAAVDELLLERREEALGDGVV